MAPPLTTVVIPVKDEVPQTILKLLSELSQYGYPTILVDDGSQQPVPEATIQLAPPGRGYGAALKVGIEKATTDLVATMDGDGQHTALDVKRLEDFMIYFHDNRPDLGHYNPTMVVGNRRVREPTWQRFWGRKLLNWTASLFAKKWIPDLNSGLRIFRRNVALGYAPILCDGFSFTTGLTLAMMADGYYVDFLPIKVWPRKGGSTKIRLFRDGWKTLRTICWIGIALNTRPLRGWLRHCRLT